MMFPILFYLIILSSYCLPFDIKLSKTVHFIPEHFFNNQLNSQLPILPNYFQSNLPSSLCSELPSCRLEFTHSSSGEEFPTFLHKRDHLPYSSSSTQNEHSYFTESSEGHNNNNNNSKVNKSCIYSIKLSSLKSLQSGSGSICHGMKMTLYVADTFVLQIFPTNKNKLFLPQANFSSENCLQSKFCLSQLHTIELYRFQTSSEKLHNNNDNNNHDLFFDLPIGLLDNIKHKTLLTRQRKRRSVNSNSASSPFNEHQTSSEYILELYLIVDQKLARSYMHLFQSYDPLVHRIKVMLCFLNAAYAKFGVTVKVVQLEIWELDVFSLNYVDDQNLHQLEKFKQTSHVQSIRHDCLHALLGHDHANSRMALQGKSYRNTMCGQTRCVGFSRLSINQSDAESTRTVIHELGHNFGLRHDTEECQCEGCLMASTAPFGQDVMDWSVCSIEQMRDIFDHGGGMCLLDSPFDSLSKSSSILVAKQHGTGGNENEDYETVTIHSVSHKGAGENLPVTFEQIDKTLNTLAICGNYIVEEGEECDSGTVDSKCCLKTCRLRSWARCASGLCCDVSSCQFHPSGFLCRDSRTAANDGGGDDVDNENSCDLPEYCDGQSYNCPANLYKINGHQCTISEKANKTKSHSYCFNGHCANRESQCQMLWGDTARVAPDECIRQNILADDTVVKNCGKKTTMSSSSSSSSSGAIDFRKSSGVRCENEEDAKCGRLWCVHNNIRLMHFGEYEKVSYQPGYNSPRCDAVVFDVGWNVTDPGMVPDGSPCGRQGNKVCHRGKCVPLVMPICTCHNNGVCNNLGECHCKVGYLPPTCQYVGNGGSISSGPAPTSSTIIALRLLTIVSVCVCCPAILALIIYMLRKHPGGTGSHCLDRFVYMNLRVKMESLRLNVHVNGEGNDDDDDDDDKPPSDPAPTDNGSKPFSILPLLNRSSSPPPPAAAAVHYHDVIPEDYDEITVTTTADTIDNNNHCPIVITTNGNGKTPAKGATKTGGIETDGRKRTTPSTKSLTNQTAKTPLPKPPIPTKTSHPLLTQNNKPIEFPKLKPIARSTSGGDGRRSKPVSRSPSGERQPTAVLFNDKKASRGISQVKSPPTLPPVNSKPIVKKDSKTTLTAVPPVKKPTTTTGSELKRKPTVPAANTKPLLKGKRNNSPSSVNNPKSFSSTRPTISKPILKNKLQSDTDSNIVVASSPPPPLPSSPPSSVAVRESQQDEKILPQPTRNKSLTTLSTIKPTSSQKSLSQTSENGASGRLKTTIGKDERPVISSPKLVKCSATVPVRDLPISSTTTNHHLHHHHQHHQHLHHSPQRGGFGKVIKSPESPQYLTKGSKNLAFNNKKSQPRESTEIYMCDLTNL